MGKRFWILPSMMGKAVGHHCIEYEFIDPLKNLRSTLILKTKELILVILRITKLRLLYLFGFNKVLSFI